MGALSLMRDWRVANLTEAYGRFGDWRGYRIKGS